MKLTRKNAVVISSAARNLLLLLFLIAYSASTQAQTGTPPFGSYGGGPDIINLSNLNAHLSIPVLHKAGRGLPFAYDLSFDSSIWYPAGQVWTPGVQATWGWQGVLPTTGGFYITYSLSTASGPCGNPANNGSYWEYIYNNFQYYDSVGIVHAFNNLATYWVNSTGGPGCPPSGSLPGTTQSAIASDGSGYTMYVPSAPDGGAIYASVVDKNGTAVNAPVVTNPSGQWGSLLETDRNGNQISGDANGNFYDTLNSTTATVTVAGSGTPASPKSFSFKAPNGNTVAFQLNYTQYTVATNFGISGITE